MPLIQCFLYWTRHSWNWTVQWNPIYISINLILPLLACWLDFADSCAICCYKTLKMTSKIFLVYRQHLPERRCFEASSYSEGGLGSDQRIELRISTETPLDIPPPPPNYIRKVRNKLAHGSVFGQILGGLQNFQNLLQRSRLCGIWEFTLCQQDGRWLKIYIIIGIRQVSKQSGMWQKLVQSLFDIQWLALHMEAKGQMWYLSLVMVSSHGSWSKWSNKQRTSHKGGVNLKPFLWYAEHEVT